MATGDEPARLSVSRDALRADLAEMELRLQNFIAAQLAGKADRADLVALSLAVNDLKAVREARDRGDFTDAQRRSIADLARSVTREDGDAGWTRRERFFTSVAIIVTVLTLALSAYLAFGAGHKSGAAPPGGSERTWVKKT